jgi:hypothetical protein
VVGIRDGMMKRRRASARSGVHESRSGPADTILMLCRTPLPRSCCTSTLARRSAIAYRLFKLFSTSSEARVATASRPEPRDPRLETRDSRPETRDSRPGTRDPYSDAASPWRYRHDPSGTSGAPEAAASGQIVPTCARAGIGQWIARHLRISSRSPSADPLLSGTASCTGHADRRRALLS